MVLVVFSHLASAMEHSKNERERERETERERERERERTSELQTFGKKRL